MVHPDLIPYLQVVQLADKDATYHLMDACAMDFPSHSFDAVVDKGTLDAMLSVEDEEQSR